MGRHQRNDHSTAAGYELPWLRLQAGCGYVAWQGDWVPICLRVGPDQYVPIARISAEQMSEIRAKEDSSIAGPILGLPTMAALVGDRLEFYPTPVKAYDIVQLPTKSLVDA
jgi:hypothetical protein